MKNIVYLLIIFISANLRSQETNTLELLEIINHINGKSVKFYNFIEYKDDLFITSDSGVYKIEDDKLIKFNSEKGFLKINSKKQKIDFVKTSPSNVIKDAELIKIMPSILINQLTDAIKKNDYIFIISNSDLFILKKKNYTVGLKGISIRTLSEKYIGTYKGIYDYKENLIDSFPDYTNSYIREFGNEVIINYDGIYRLKDSISTHFRNPITGEFRIFNKNLGFVENTEKLNDSTYFILTNKGIFLTDFFFNLRVIDTSTQVDRSQIYKLPKLIHNYNISDSNPENRVLFYHNQKLKLSDYNFNEIITIHEFKTAVISFCFFNDKLFYIDEEGVKTYFNSKVNFLIDQNEYHTVKVINENSLLLASDLGLFKYDLAKNSLISISNQEFNRKAIKITKDTIYAGSTNGLYKIGVNDFMNLKPKISYNKYNFDYFLFLSLLIIIGLLILIYLRDSKGVIEIEKDIVQEINNYIDLNLNKVTVASIQQEFNVSYRKLSKIYDGIGPGKIIETRRKHKLKNLKDQGLSLDQISLLTGYNLQYLKRLN